MAGGVIGLLTKVDKDGNEQVLFPVTPVAAVDGLKEEFDKVNNNIKDSVNAKTANATCVLSASDWSEGSQSKTVQGVTATNNVIVSPAPSSYVAAMEAGVYCSGQSEGALSFAYIKQPTQDITMNILIVN